MKRTFLVLFSALCFLIYVPAYPQEPDDPFSPDKLKEAEKLVKEVYAEGLAKRQPDEVKAFAQELLKEGGKNSNADATRYVLFEKAAELAASVGDVNTVMTAVDGLEVLTDSKLYKLRQNYLDSAIKKIREPELFAAAGNAYIALAESWVSVDAYDSAEDCLKSAYIAARGARNKTMREEAVRRKKEISDLEKEYRKAEKALKILETKPDAPEANLDAGSYYCFVKGNWEKGLPMLAKGPDSSLKEIAARDVKFSSLSDEDVVWEKDGVIKLGDGWLELAEKERDKTLKGHMASRAGFWYDKVVATLEGLQKKLFENKYEQIEKMTAGLSGGAITASAPHTIKLLWQDEFEGYERKYPQSKDTAEGGEVTSSQVYGGRAADNLFKGNRTGVSWTIDHSKEGWMQVEYKKSKPCSAIILFGRPTGIGKEEADKTGRNENFKWGKESRLIVNDTIIIPLEDYAAPKIALIQFRGRIAVKKIRIEMKGADGYSGLAAIEIHP